MKLQTIYQHTLLALLIVSQLACSNATQKGSESTIKPVIENEGVKIAYDDTRTGDTTLLFVHGWGINRAYWSPQVSAFKKSYRVVTVDLPGFGESGRNRQSWTVENYAKDISAVIKTLQLKYVILIGHSMSGFIVLETALTNPQTVLGIIGIDNFNTYGWVETPTSKKETDAFFNMARANYKKVVSGFVNETLFAPSTDSLVRKRVTDDIIQSDSIIAVNSLELNMRYPADARLKEWHKALYLINSSMHPTDTLSFSKGGINVQMFDVGLTGHYPMIEKPEAFNNLLAQAIEKIKSNSN